MAYARNGDFAHALPYADSSVSMATQTSISKVHTYYFLRGFILFNLAKYENALADFNSNLALFKELYTNLLLSGKYEILPQFNLDHSDTEIYYFRGKTYYALGKYKEACSDWKTIIDRAPEVNAVFITKKDIDEAYATCSRKMRK